MTRGTATAPHELLTHVRKLRIESLEERRLLTFVASLVSDISPGSADTTIERIADVNDIPYFFVNRGGAEAELWKSDGTTVGTVFISDINELYTNYIGDAGGTLFFASRDEVRGRELWRTNQAGNGIEMVQDIHSGAEGAYPRYLTDMAGALYFSADDGAHGRELWTIRGDRAVQLTDLGPGPTDPRFLTAVGQSLYFSSGYDLWKYDGTNADTAQIATVSGRYQFPIYLTNVAGTLFFVSADDFARYAIWNSDGTPEGTRSIREFAPGSLNFPPSRLTNVDGTLFFVADDGVSGYELWKSNGTAAGTTLVKDIRSGSIGSYSPSLINVNGILYFTPDDGASGCELWESDGTTEGTIRVRDIWPGTEASCPQHLTNVNGMLFFTAEDGKHGIELWVSDGTEAGTYLVADIRQGSSGSSPSALTAVGNTLYFSADDGIHGRELWKVVVEDDDVPGDTDADGGVDLEDLNNVRNHFGAVGTGVIGDTVPFDGDVDLDDLNAVRNNFGAASSLSSELLAKRNAPTRALVRDELAFASLADATQPAETLRSDHVQVAFDQVHAYAAGVWHRCNEALSDLEVEAPGRLAITARARRDVRR